MAGPGGKPPEVKTRSRAEAGLPNGERPPAISGAPAPGLSGRHVLAPFGRACAAAAWRILGRPFDRRHGVSTARVEPLSNFTIGSENVAHATEYAPTPVRGFWLSVGSLDIDSRRFSFVDLGSGKGRTVVLAAKLPFRSIEGIEFSKELHELARRNVEASCRPSDRDRIKLYHGDVVDHEFPEHPLVVYLFNPFGPPVLAAVLRNLASSFRRRPRPIFVVYMNPVHRGLFEARGFRKLPGRWFDRMAGTPFAIYQLQAGACACERPGGARGAPEAPGGKPSRSHAADEADPAAREERSPPMILMRSKPAGLAALALAATALALLAPSAKAHDESATIGELSIDNVAATAARPGEQTKVTFSIENSGPQGIVVTGVRLEAGEPSRVMAFLGHIGHTGEIGSVRVGSGENVTVDGKKLWIEVGPLEQELIAGSRVGARLLLGAYEVPLSIHVAPKG